MRADPESAGNPGPTGSSKGWPPATDETGQGHVVVEDAVRRGPESKPRNSRLATEHSMPLFQGLPQNDCHDLSVNVVEQSEMDLEAFIRIAGLGLEQEMKQCNRDILELVQDLGGSSSRYAKERRKGLKNLIVELYSAPRVTSAAKLLPDMRHLPGVALDLTTTDADGNHWDFSLKEMREKAWDMIVREQPELVIGSPMCTAFCMWQHLVAARTGKHAELEEKKRLATEHIKFCCSIYLHQVSRGRLFLHEHPASACSWNLACIQEVMEKKGVKKVEADQCQFGSIDDSGSPIKKPTSFLSNSECILQMLQRRCSGRGGMCSCGVPHVACSGKTARRPAIYPIQATPSHLEGLQE